MLADLELFIYLAYACPTFWCLPCRCISFSVSHLIGTCMLHVWLSHMQTGHAQHRDHCMHFLAACVHTVSVLSVLATPHGSAFILGDTVTTVPGINACDTSELLYLESGNLHQQNTVLWIQRMSHQQTTVPWNQSMLHLRTAATEIHGGLWVSTEATMFMFVLCSLPSDPDSLPSQARSLTS